LEYWLSVFQIVLVVPNPEATLWYGGAAAKCNSLAATVAHWWRRSWRVAQHDGQFATNLAHWQRQRSHQIAKHDDLGS